MLKTDHPDRRTQSPILAPLEQLEVPLDYSRSTALIAASPPVLLQTRFVDKQSIARCRRAWYQRRDSADFGHALRSIGARRFGLHGFAQQRRAGSGATAPPFSIGSNEAKPFPREDVIAAWGLLPAATKCWERNAAPGRRVAPGGRSLENPRSISTIVDFAHVFVYTRP